MSSDNLPVDFSSSMSYNDSNDVYDRVADNILSRPAIVKMDEQVPIHDNKCTHEQLVPDEDDRIGEAVYHGCANPKCGVGFYIKT